MDEIAKLSTIRNVSNAVLDQAVTYACNYLTPRQKAEILSPSGAKISQETKSAISALATNPQYIKGISIILNQMPDRRKQTLKKMTPSQFKEYIGTIHPKRFIYTPNHDITKSCVEFWHTFNYNSIYIAFCGWGEISFRDTCTDSQISFYQVKYVQLISRDAFRIVCHNLDNPKDDDIKHIVKFE